MLGYFPIAGRRLSGFVAFAGAVAIVMAFPAAAAASKDFRVTVRDERDPVPLGGEVVYHVTLVNVGDVAADVPSLALDGGTKGSDRPTKNRLTRVDASQGSCTIEQRDRFPRAVCAVPQLAPGGRVEIVARFTARESMEFSATGADCSTCVSPDGNILSADSTTVVGLTRISVLGVPRRCTSRDFSVRARATVTGLPVQNAYVLLDRRFSLGGLGVGRYIRFVVPARGLRRGRHRLTFVVERVDDSDNSTTAPVRRVFTFRRC